MARLLIVDDEVLNLTLLRDYLAPLGYETTAVADGRRALDVFMTERPDMVLLDLRMPDMDGIDILLHIRAEDEAQGTHTPVILITGSVQDERVRGLEAGADEFLEKPVERAVLVARVRTLLRLKEATDALVERNAALQRLHEAQAELMHFVVHDLKSPLAGAMTNVAWARRQVPEQGSETGEALADAEHALGCLGRLVENLLTIARLEEADLPVQKRGVPVADLVADVLRSSAREAAQRRVGVTASVDEGACVEADPALLERVLHNLVENALRHTPANGRVEVSASRDGATIAVSNDGREMAEAERARVFEKFRRGSGERGGLRNVGLGLYFCKRAMEAQGGSIALVQTPAWPVSFVLRLPRGERKEG